MCTIYIKKKLTLYRYNANHTAIGRVHESILVNNDCYNKFWFGEYFLVRKLLVRLGVHNKYLTTISRL